MAVPFFLSLATPCLRRILKFPLHHNTPAVERLPVHLENEHTVTFDEVDGVAELGAEDRCTALYAWLQYNREHPEDAHARALTYVEFPEWYVLEHKHQQKTWRPRRVTRQQGSRPTTIGRVYFSSPRAGEKYFLRVLLHHVTGAATFAQLRTVEGVEHPTYRDACVARGLLEDDREWRACLAEAVVFQYPHQLRTLFVILLEYNHPQDPAALWQEFKNDLSADKRYDAEQRVLTDGVRMLSDDEIENEALWDIEQLLKQSTPPKSLP